MGEKNDLLDKFCLLFVTCSLNARQTGTLHAQYGPAVSNNIS